MFKKLHKFLTIFALAGAFLVPVVMSSHGLAVNVLNGPCPSGTSQDSPTVCKDNSYNSNDNPIFGPDGIITKAVKIISWVVGVLAIILVIIGGLRMIVSGGDSNSVSSARNSIIYALIGLAVAAFAQVIVAFVLDKIG